MRATLREPYPELYLAAASGLDCDDANPSVWRLFSAYPDADGDGFGAGPAVDVCIGRSLPWRWSPVTGDCAPDDATHWLRRTGYADVDGDGVGAGPAVEVLYPDADGDGVGAPPRSVQCLGATIPHGFSRQGWDVDDGNPAVQQDPDDEALLTILL